MAAVVVLGEEVLVAGYALAGARILPAEDADAVLERWAGLVDGRDPAPVAVVVLTPRAADVVGARRDAPDAPLSVVMPP